MAKIIGGSSNKTLLKDLNKVLGFDFIDAKIERFADQELRIELPCPLYNDNVLVVQSTSCPANDHLMELLLLVDAVKRLGAKKIVALIPYFGYSRQDRRSYDFSPISASLVANIIESSGVDHLITFDLHSKQLEGFFNIGVQNIDPLELFASFIKEKNNAVIVSPDVGGMVRARKLGSILSVEIAVINKIRKNHNECSMNEIIGDVKGKNCVLVDDIVDTGNTLCKAAELVMQNGALSVEAFVSHAVLSKNSIDNLQQSHIRKIITTKTIEQKKLPSKFVVIDIVPILCDSIRKIILK
jgi:ribose-phosphate pyrophosphokinase